MILGNFHTGGKQTQEWCEKEVKALSISLVLKVIILRIQYQGK